MVGHGAQKLFGSFGGPGLEGTSGFMEMLGMRPGRPWAYLAGLAEFGGGVLTALGLLHPLGPLGIIGAMSMATRKAHWGKPVWATEGGGPNCSPQHRGLYSPHDPRARQVLPRSHFGDPPAGMGRAVGPRGDHTHRALRRARSRQAI